ncbi:MAG: serpin family protein [Polyangiaceae bacterium]|nr:serpin family protein [Polyangiaceae bacterium]
MRFARALALWMLVSGAVACDAPTSQEPSVATTSPPSTSAPASAAPVATGSASSDAPAMATETPVSKPAAPTANETARVAAASNAFGTDLYAKLRDKKGNLAFSPASITTALAMTWGGAKGETAEQMKKVLHFDASASEIAPIAGKLATALQDPSRAVKLRIANRLFGEKTYSFEAPFLSMTKTSFGAPLEPTDFKGDPSGARKLINGWVEEQTEKRIKDLVPPTGINKETRLTLVNAIFFLGDWSEPFTKTATTDQDFTVAKATKKKVPTMRRMGRYQHAEVGGVQALELDYKGGATSMLVLLPKDEPSMAAFEKSLTASKIDELVKALEGKKVDVSLPKFEIDPAESVALADMLKTLGMPTAFDPEKADFTGIANPKNPADRLYVGNVFHKAFVKVDEKGTEAAAGTAVVMPRAGSAPSPDKPVVFNADHPFVFVLRDRESGLILFMGRVSDPTATAKAG